MSEADENLLSLEPIKDTPMSPAVAVAGVALSLALKYHDINMVKDGALYQQYKLEGKNFRDLHLDVVFETAIRIEQHLMTSSNRLSETIYGGLIEALAEGAELDDEDGPDGDGGAEQPA